MNSKEAFIALNMIEHVGPVRVRQLLTRFSTPEEILAAPRERLLQVPGIGVDTAQAICQWQETVDLQSELRRIEQAGCGVLTQDDPDYPPLLRQIYDPPIALYLKGSLTAADRNAVAVVGSRMTTPYGIEAARRFGFQLARSGVTVVSGGARGIDTAAHQGALNARGRTAAVLGTGIDLVFPPENAALFERIAASGAVMTQFPFGRTPDKQSFPIRNRIVAGMTLGTLVVEANLTSGALITANMALDAGRQVFAVPGRIDSPRSRGCHDLIKKGAKLCEGVEDILTEFEYLFPPSNRGTDLARDGSTSADGSDAATCPPLELSARERCVFDVLTVEPASIDEVIERSGQTAAVVSVALLSLELKRFVRQHPGRLFARFV